jgi:dTDP-4-dehydrorhamnose 3,5-epimerase
MIFQKTKFDGAWLIDLQKHEDERGFFARAFCQREYLEHGMNPTIAQCNFSHNNQQGTLRGMHLQVGDFQEAKLVQCTQGAIYDVMVDVRPESPTFCQYEGVVLTAKEHRMLYIPEGFAHGFLTLEADTTIFYQMSQFYAPDYGRGFRWNDPAFGIAWPAEVKVISPRDATYPDFSLDQLR